MNILFTCVGRRVELIQCFKDAAKECKINLKIFATENDDTAPALRFCNKYFLVPKIQDKKYVSSLLTICKNNKINAIIPTIDTDLLLLSKCKQDFENLNTKIIISNLSEIKICRNKLLTAAFFSKIGINTPKIIENYKNYNGPFPVFLKPTSGSSSINTYKLNNTEEVKLITKKIKNFIILQFIEGTEYTVDTFNDFDGKPLLITPRIRIAVRSGEVSKTQIVNDKTIINEIKKIMKHLTLIGPSTIQLIRSNYDNKDYFIEINPRFGGGSPISIKAGANSPVLLLKLLNGCKIKKNIKYNAIDKSIWSRFDQSIRVK